MNPSLSAILDAREKRAQTQKELLTKYKKPLVCFTLNIPGPEKWNRDVSIGFFVGVKLLKDAVGHKLLHFSQRITPAGSEGFFVVDIPAKQLKEITVSIEDSHLSGRVFDMDVLDTDGRKIERTDLGLPRRTCLLCDNDAVVCAGSRAHPLEQLEDRTGFLLYVAARELFAEFIGVQAYLALLKEVQATPKPGLVDRNNTGAHKDMDLRHFFVSANALRPYFVSVAEAGYLTRDNTPEETFQKIRPIGVKAEQTMLSATGGVNTHKGAIFSLGLLCAAAGRLSPENWSPETLLSECAAMIRGIVEKDMGNLTAENAETFGKKLFLEQGITGIRGQAQAGFPAVLNTGLPMLKKCLAMKKNENDALCISLLHLIAVTDDTNLIHRSNRQTQLAVQEKIKALLKENPCPDKAVMEALDKEFIENNLSPGGSADLLALSCLLHALTSEEML